MKTTMQHTQKDAPESARDPAEHATAGSLAALLTKPLKDEDGGAPAVSEEHAEDGKEVVIDGERIILKAGASIELRCGESVIRMNKDGVIEIRGNYIISQASATQRLRGGSVHVN